MWGWLLASCFVAPGAFQAGGSEERQPWTTSRITGSPEPPPPYRLARDFARLTFDKPVELVRSPELARLLVVQQYGKVYSFPERGDPAQADLVIDLPQEVRGIDRVADTKGVDQSFGLAFHPRFAENRYVYVAYTLGHKTKGKSLPTGSRISRFTIPDADPPRADPASERILLEWPEGGHNGCCLRFGPDGFLYISTGDGTEPNPPDRLDTGQDVSDLLGSILRIDVDRSENGRPYRVPPDNPFLRTEGARPEIWAYGFRNPWRMSFDAAGNLWAGDVGWELWELLYCVERGGNYGWSLMEGPQPVRPHARRGPTPVLPPAMALPHTEAASITGGYVYRGKRHPELRGRYVFADFELYRLFDARVEGRRLSERRELARTQERVVAFAEDRDGELLLLDYVGGGIHRMERNDAGGYNPRFPRKLGETGLFASTAGPAPGVYPYSIRSPRWVDQATAERFVGVPGKEVVRSDRGRPAYPKDMALAKTLSLDGKRVETQVLHFDGKDWQAYTYAWDEAEKDADLVGALGAERTIGDRRWTYHARATCIGCHSTSWVRDLQGFIEPQVVGAERLRRLGVLAPSGKPMADPADASADLEFRARSYLHVNCAVCHRPGGGGTSMIDLRRERALHETHALNARPSLGAFGIADASIIAAGDPSRSALFYRMAKSGHGRMPYVGSSLVDAQGLELVARWIERLPAAGPAREDERDLVRKLRDGAPPGPALERLLSSTSGALDLVRAIGELPAKTREELLARAMKAPDAIRGLFERFVPADRRPPRLGPRPDPAGILALRGDASRGRHVFFEAIQCGKCHAVGGQGDSFGPDLSGIATRLSRAQILESVLEPSKSIDPKYVVHVVQTADEEVLTGLVVERTEEALVLRDPERKDRRIPARSIRKVVAQRTSGMPEFLLQDLTVAEAADLLEFLGSLK